MQKILSAKIWGGGQMHQKWVLYTLHPSAEDIYSTPVRRRYILYPRPPKNTEVYGLLPTVCNVTFERFIFKAFFFAEIAGTELG